MSRQQPSCLPSLTQLLSPVQAEVRAREARTVFNSYDRNRSGALEIEELQTCLEDLGLMVRRMSFLTY